MFSSESDLNSLAANVIMQSDEEKNCVKRNKAQDTDEGEKKSEEFHNNLPESEGFSSTEVANLVESSPKNESTKQSCKVPVLRICINRKYRDCKNGAGINSEDVENGVDEIEIDSATKSVVFRLDPETNEILVLERERFSLVGDEDEDCQGTCDMNSKDSKNLTDLYSKAQKDCTLLKKHLAILKRRQKEEQKKITILQNELQNINSGHRRTRLEVEKRPSVSEEDEYDELLRRTMKLTETLTRTNNSKAKRMKKEKEEIDFESANLDEETYDDVEYLDPEYILP